MSKEITCDAGLLPARLRAFGADETGNLTVFGLVMLFLMTLIGGIAVDVMRYEVRRTQLQNTLDRSTLAAASLTQEMEPTDVVEDYFLKAGILPTLRDVEVTQGLNFRNVQASASSDTDPLFLHMMDIDDLDASGLSTAEQRINNVEIFLVLDVSGSMANNNRLVNLKSAARNFVSTVLGNDAEDKISIGIVPFNGQVNLGERLASEFTLTDPNGTPERSCVDLGDSLYSQLDIPRDVALSMTANADTFSTSGATAPAETNKWCPNSTGNIVRMPHQDIATLQGYIDGLTAIGATSINAGLKWGVALMDPSMRDVYDDYMEDGLMPTTLDQRPLAYDHEDAMKVIVLMTDGEHFAEERVKPAYKSGISNLWQATDGRWSAFHSSRVNTSTSTTLCNSRPFWVPHLGVWHSRPWNGTSPTSSACYNPSAVTANTTNRTWPHVWANLRVKYVARYLFANAVGGTETTWTNEFREQTATTDMDDQLQEICTLAKDEDTLIYGIAFEVASTTAQAQISNCATSPAHFFNATGLQISSAFSAIANNISQLRLTQ